MLMKSPSVNTACVNSIAVPPFQTTDAKLKKIPPFSLAASAPEIWTVLFYQQYGAKMMTPQFSFVGKML